MKIQRFNWQIWTGFVLSIFAFLSYPLVFVNWAVTRNFPWANLLLFAMFIFVAFVASRWLPASTGAPQVGQKAPEFTLVDTNNKSSSLSELLSSPITSVPLSAGGPRAPKGVLLIFYRGYW